MNYITLAERYPTYHWWTGQHILEPVVVDITTGKQVDALVEHLIEQIANVLPNFDENREENIP